MGIEENNSSSMDFPELRTAGKEIGNAEAREGIQAATRAIRELERGDRGREAEVLPQAMKEFIQKQDPSIPDSKALETGQMVTDSLAKGLNGAPAAIRGALEAGINEKMNEALARNTSTSMESP